MEGFVTKDSGERQQFSTGMQRDIQQGKARFDLICPLGLPYRDQLLTRIAELFGRGAEKYGDRNWEQARTDEEHRRFKDAAFRHFMQWLCGDRSEDHAAAVFFNVQGAEYVHQRMLLDDHLRSPGLEQFWKEHAAWSQATFGLDTQRGPEGALNHLKREVKEAIENPKDGFEYADMLFLVFDAARRSGLAYEGLLQYVWEKLEINKARKWGKPDAEGVCSHVKETPTDGNTPGLAKTEEAAPTMPDFATAYDANGRPIK